MYLEQALAALENIHTDPVPAIESLISERHEADDALLKLLVTLQAGGKPPVDDEAGLPHPLIQRVRLRLSRGANSRVVMRRIVIALGAIQSTRAVPVLLDLLARRPFDRKLGDAASWSLANIGEVAVLPLFSFARRRDNLVPARSLAIVTLGYIADSRVPAILRHLWREYRLEAPRLAIAALIGLALCGQDREARARAEETERLWRSQETHEDIWVGLEFESATESLHRTLEYVGAGEALPAWPRVMQMLGSA